MAVEVGSSSPPTGNHPSVTASSVSSTIPSQKSGMDHVPTLNAVDA